MDYEIKMKFKGKKAERKTIDALSLYFEMHKMNHLIFTLEYI